MKHTHNKVLQTIVLFLALVTAILAGWNVVYATGGGNALDFDGVMDATGDYVTAGFDPSATLGQSFTIEAWVNPHSAQSYRGIGGDHAPPHGIGFGQYEAGTGGWIFFGYDGTAPLPIAIVPTIPLNQWSHVAAVYVGNATGPGRITVYLNGEFAAQSSWSNRTFSHMSTFYIGRAYGSEDDRFFDGQIDDFRVWNTARTGADIQADMVADLTGSESNLVAYYTFNQG